MTPTERTRYLAAYEAAYPGDIAARAKDEHDDIAEEMREVAEAADIDAAVSVLQSYEYGGDYLHLAKAARAMRAALGITDPPEPPTAEELAARLREVERERDEARAERDRLQAILDAERGVKGPNGWIWGSMWIADGRLARPVTGRRADGTIGRVWEWSSGVLVDGERRLAGGTRDLAIEAMEAADAAVKEEG